MTHTNGVKRALCLLAAVPLLSLTACGNADTSSPSSKTTVDQAAVSKSAELQAALKPIELQLPETPVDVSKLAGKAVYYIAPSLSIPIVSRIAKAFEQATTKAGLKPTVFDGRGNVATFNQGITEAINQRAAAIVLQAIDPAIVSGPLAKAKRAGIPVVDLNNRVPDAPLPDTIKAQVTFDYRHLGEMNAEYLAATAGGKARIAVLTWPIYKIYEESIAGFEDVLGEKCSDCKVVKTIGISPTASQSQVQQTVLGALRADPNIDYLYTVSDSLGVQVLPVLPSLGRNVKVLGAESDMTALHSVATGRSQIADAGYVPGEYTGWAVADQVLRVMAGQPAAQENTSLPSQLFDRTNLPTSMKTDGFAETSLAQLYPGLDGFEAGFARLWGVG